MTDSDVSRLSGTVRDGVWSITGAVARYSPPGTFHVEVLAWDRVGHESRRIYKAPTLTVKDRDPDTQPPAVVALLRPRPHTMVDVRKAAHDVVVKAHVTDDLSGAFGVTLCLLEPHYGGYTNLRCPTPRLVSGTRRDGVWWAVIPIPRASVGGDWNIWVMVDERARQFYEVH